jgi:hypothetical protein
MKSLIKIGGVVVLFGLLVFFGAQLLFTQEVKQIRPIKPVKIADTTAQETYVSKVILSAPWGKKNLVYGKEESPPGEFGYHVSEETEVGPSCFAVAPNGDIYIADRLNNRIQRFNSEGGFISTIPMPISPVDICIDQNNNLYLLRYGWKPEELGDRPGTVGAVLKCDQKGNILKTYPVFTGVKATANFIYCDKFGRIFVASGGVYQVGTPTEVFSLEQQKNSEIKGFLGINSVPLDSNCFFQAASLPQGRFRALFLVSFQGDTLKTYRSYPPIQGSFFGCDKQLNIYVGSYSGMRKYNPNGDLIAGWKFGCEKPYFEVYDFGGSRGRTLDEKGNLYVLCYSEEDGIEVIKWYKQK